MSMFGQFKKAQQKIYDPEDEKVNRQGNKKNGYIGHECDVVVSLRKLREGRVDNAGSKIDKHHFVSAEVEIEKIRWQKDTKPMTTEDLEAGKEPIPAETLQEGQTKDVFIRLPRHLYEDPDEYTVAELHMIGDLCDFMGAILGVESDAVDLGQMDELAANDGEALQGAMLGILYKESQREATEKKPARVYLNENPYPVDDDTLERTDPMTAEEVEELMAESAA